MRQARQIVQLTPARKRAITAALEKLGPTRVAHARAEARGRTWRHCFLAMAYGPCGALARETDVRDADAFVLLRNRFKLTFAQAGAVVELFDGNRPAFNALVDEWLEHNVVVPWPAPRQRRRVRRGSLTQEEVLV